MTVDQQTKFFYLNRENGWLDFQCRGLELKDGWLRLASLPFFEAELTDELAQLTVPDGPAGIAVGQDGTIYFTDPLNDRVLRINSCDGTTSAAPCLGGTGTLPTLFSAPRGILFHRQRQAIFIADSGNHRVQIFHAETFQLMDIWGQEDPASDPVPNDQPGSFNTPWSLAADREGNVYVVDVGNRRVQKFDLFGQVVKHFWDTARPAVAGDAPTEVAVGDTGHGEKLYVLAPATGKLFVLDTRGQLLRTIASEKLKHAMGLTVAGGAIYVGDNDSHRILKFWSDGTLVGEAQGFHGPVAALAWDEHAQLLVHTGSIELEILRLSPGGAYAKRGFMWGGPFGASDPMLKDWYRLKAFAVPLAPDAHLRLFTYASDDTANPPVPIQPDEHFSSAVWKPLSPDVTDGLIGGGPKSYLWVGAEFSGEGLSTPALSQMRVDYDHEGYLRYFPAIYREDPIKRAFLEKLLALYESLFDDTEQQIRSLNVLFDTSAALAQFLEWLAGWLALDLDERWSEEKKRQAIAQAFELYGRRGTAEGLREALRFFAGADALIEEPILYSSWWTLPGEDAGDGSESETASLLGFGTTLAPEEAQGAVVGTTATYDESSLITIDEFGAPLFASVAHRFVVRLQSAQAGSAERRRELQAIIDREKPAHTVAHLCVIEPGLSVGFQARLGVDSVLGGESPLARLDQAALGGNLQLGGDPAGRVGKQSQLGQTTRLGDVGPDGRSSVSDKRQAREATRPRNWPRII